MVIFYDKIAFTTRGLEPITPSPIHASQDCSLCKDPLATHPSHTIDFHTKYHAAVRINACGHVVGKECLDLWLDVGHTCPTCNRLLFEPTSATITQQDITSIVNSLSRMYSERRVMSAIARLVARKEADRARLRKAHQVEAEKLLEKDRKAKREEVGMDGDDFIDSDGEPDFGEDDEEWDDGVFEDE